MTDITDEMVNAAAREMWNDRDARHGGSWDERDPREVCVIQTKATAKAALVAALAANNQEAWVAALLNAPDPAATPSTGDPQELEKLQRKGKRALAATEVDQADYKIGWWLSAALEDPNVCAEMKADINKWFEAHQPNLDMSHSRWGISPTAATPAVGGDALDAAIHLINLLRQRPRDSVALRFAEQDFETVLEKLRAQPTSPLRTLETLIREYARDLRRNSSGSDDYPWEYAKVTADYLEILISRSIAVDTDFREVDEAVDGGVTDEMVERALKVQNLDLIQGFTYKTRHVIRDFRTDKGTELWSGPLGSHPEMMRRIEFIKMKLVLEAASAAAQEQPAAAPAAGRNELRKLVDIVWNEATESTQVPSTKWADRMIDRAFPNVLDKRLLDGETGV